MAEVRSEKRVALGVSNRSEWLGSECRGVEELSVGLVRRSCIADLVWPILPSAVERGRTIVIAVLFAIALDRIIGAAAGFGDRERLATLSDRDRIRLPSREDCLLDTSEALSELQFVIKRERKAILDVVSAMPYSI